MREDNAREGSPGFWCSCVAVFRLRSAPSAHEICAVRGNRETFHRIRQLSVLIFVLALLPLAAMAGPPGPPTRTVGQYFLSNDDLDLAGGAVLYSDCSHDGSIVAAIPAGPPAAPRIVAKLVATDWVNDPDPDLWPYTLWPVPAALEDMSRLLLCYDLQPISGPPLPFNEFCDWAPRRATYASRLRSTSMETRFAICSSA